MAGPPPFAPPWTASNTFPHHQLIEQRYVAPPGVSPTPSTASSPSQAPSFPWSPSMAMPSRPWPQQPPIFCIPGMAPGSQLHPFQYITNQVTANNTTDLAPGTTASVTTKPPSIPDVDKNVDVNELISNLKTLVSQTRESVDGILKMMKMSKESLPLSNVDPTMACRSASVLSRGNCKPIQGIFNFESSEEHQGFEKASKVFSDIYEYLKGQRDITNFFFYKDAPGVVQVPADFSAPMTNDVILPSFAVGEKWIELASESAEDSCMHDSGSQRLLLPSRLWLLRKEIDLWNDLPGECTVLQLEVTSALTKLKRRYIKQWLITHLRSYGLVPSKDLVNHIVVLLVFCFRAIHRESYLILTETNSSKYKNKENIVVQVNEHKESQNKRLAVESKRLDFKVLSESACWLSTQLSPLCSPTGSKALIQDIYKHAIKTSAYCLAFPAETHYGKLTEVDSARVETAGSGNDLASSEAENKSDLSAKGQLVGDGILSLQHLAEALLCIQDHTYFQQSKNSISQFFLSPSYQRAMMHNMVVTRAEEVRSTRTDYRPVIEHDGLLWQKPQNQDVNRKKTQEEILAEERDYKRRRMSYRGKKVKRTPKEILRDIIEGHMEDIVASGGIGCVAWRQDLVPSLKAGSEPSTNVQYGRHEEGEYQRREEHMSSVHSSSSKSERRHEHYDEREHVYYDEMKRGHHDERNYERRHDGYDAKQRGQRHGAVTWSSRRSNYGDDERSHSQYHKQQGYERSSHSRHAHDSSVDWSEDSGGTKYNRWENT